MLNSEVYPFENVPFVGYWSIYGLFLTDLFFIISGFLFTLAYKPKIENNEITFKNFIQKRITKLFPLMIISEILMVILELVYYFLNKQWWLSELNIWNIFISILGIPTGWFNMSYIVNMPVWYIGVLLQCYIIAFFIIKIQKKYDLSSFIYLLPIIIYLSLDYSGGTGLNFFILNGATSRGIQGFFVGIIMFTILKNNEKWICSHRNRVILISLIIVILVYISKVLYGDSFLGNLQYVLVYIIYPCIITILSCSRIINKLSNCKSIKFCGNISYSIYLFNLPTQLCFIILAQIFRFQFEYSSVAFWLIFTFISIIIAILFFELNRICFKEKINK